ncbi:MAG TPA: zinc-binding dehydrogenase [Thermoanaerobaculia bacterium]
MKAVVCKHSEFEVTDQPDPVPGPGQVRIKVLRGGICGGDLSARKGLDTWAAMAARVGYHRFGRSTEPIVFGHEFAGEVLEHGAGCRRGTPAGTQVVALPLLRGTGGVDTVGYSTHAPGAYAEQMLVSEALMMPVPNGLAPELAALTEPLTVSWHAVRLGKVTKKTLAIVIGCGPIGLGVILMLKAKGVETVVASDYSPGRRALATACGADVVVDPAQASPFTAVKRKSQLMDVPAALNLAVGALEKLGRLPVGWWHAWRLAEAVGAAPKPAVIFECVGAPGVLQSVVEGAPLFSRIVVVGLCMSADQFMPAMAIRKELDLQFVGAYTPLEFRDTLHMLANGKVDPRPMITATVGLNGVSSAFTALGDPEAHAKILIDPYAATTTLAAAH